MSLVPYIFLLLFISKLSRLLCGGNWCQGNHDICLAWRQQVASRYDTSHVAEQEVARVQTHTLCWGTVPLPLMLWTEILSKHVCAWQLLSQQAITPTSLLPTLSEKNVNSRMQKFPYFLLAIYYTFSSIMYKSRYISIFYILQRCLFSVTQITNQML